MLVQLLIKLVQNSEIQSKNVFVVEGIAEFSEGEASTRSTEEPNVIKFNTTKSYSHNPEFNDL